MNEKSMRLKARLDTRKAWEVAAAGLDAATLQLLRHPPGCAQELRAKLAVLREVVTPTGKKYLPDTLMANMHESDAVQLLLKYIIADLERLQIIDPLDGDAGS